MNPTAFDDEAGCILCRCDKVTEDMRQRAFMYACCVGMAAKSGVPWIAFSNCCRDHQMGINLGTKMVGEMLVELATRGASPEEINLIQSRMRENRRLMAECEVATLERYEERERELEKRGE